MIALTVQDLMKEYDSLPILEKKIIQILSIAYNKLNQTQLLACLSALNIKAENGQVFDSGNRNAMLKLFRKDLDSLLTRRLLEGKSRSILSVSPFIAEIITRRLVTENKFPVMAKAILEALELTEEAFSHSGALNPDRLTAAMRIMFYQKETEQAIVLYSKFKKYVGSVGTLFDLWRQICCTPFDPDWFKLLPPDTHTKFLKPPFIEDITHWQNSALYADYTEQLVITGSDRCESDLEAAVLEKWMLTGQRGHLDAWLKKHGKDKTENSLCLQAWKFFSDGKNAQAISCYETALDLLNKRSTSRKNIFFNNFMGIFYITALIKEGRSETFAQAKKRLSIATDSEYYRFGKVYNLLNSVLDYLTGNSRGVDSILRHTIWDYGWEGSTDLITPFFTLFSYYWVDKSEAKKKLKTIRKLRGISKKRKYFWFTRELEGLIQSLSGDNLKKDDSPNLSCLTAITKETKVWEHTLNALLRLNEKSSVKKAIDGQKHNMRLVWFLDYEDNMDCGISPREQKINAKGSWTKGRPIALKRLYDEIKKFSYMTAQDKKICSHIFANQYKDGWYTNVEYIFDDDYMPDLVGHPFLFLSDGTTRVELVEGKPEFIVSRQGNKKLKITLSPVPQRHFQEKYVVVKDTPTRIKLITLDRKYQEIADVLGKGVTVPAAAENRIRQIMDVLAGDITIHSDIEGGGEQFFETEADSRIHIQLSPLGHGLKLSMAVLPFGESGPFYPPGSGGKNVIAQVNGGRMKTTRDLKKEKKLAAELINDCPTLQEAEENQGDWLFPEVEESLELIQELTAQGDDIIVDWPEGKSFQLVGTASFNQFQLNIKKQEDWFSMTGKLVVDKQLTLDMMELLKFFEKSQSRFVEIGDGRFVELTREFRKRLQQLDRYSEKHGKGVRFHPLAALALEGFIQDVTNVRTDEAWKTHISKLQTVTGASLPVPSTLDAQLRDYQEEGVNWMTCLSTWGVGACLADDMGLGKTLQALAMLIRHAPEGPSLVIAPTSVCINWLAEAKRFAPTLNMISFAGNNRKNILNVAGKFDVLVCSYGLMQQKKAAEMLSEISWQMVVLDEAQAIKNFATQRSRAAMQLKAAFKVILTGTPIENHLGELWNLFQFITPGLLGSLNRFNKIFAIPIEKNGDNQARKDLKRLIQPFILRRTKSQVLEELPARTEIRLDIDLSEKEMAFYEALRRQALDRLSNDNETHPGKKHLKILAELTKLRQACCHSELVNKEISIPSSKLAVFSETLEDLLQNRHKALVFSQFVGHLSIIRNYLDEARIKYQYLDGSTPTSQRKKAIDAFQAGEGDVFLISLKAGGVGLNLTAADYVVHLDPWWNPAVEDQASDRAHRIGQQRPVTIYRLVTRDTVEDKIVRMHSRKRDLADSLLKGSDISGKMSAEELLELIRD